MKKSLKIMAVISAIALTFGIVGCSDKTTYPDFNNPTNTTEEESSEKYKINIVSAGGLKLDGVRVTAYRGDAAIKSGISSDGVINLGVTLGEYTLVIDEDTLPDGYYIDETTTYKTNPDKREEVTIEIPSKVISRAASSSTAYSLGDIVHDFSFKSYDNKTYKLSSLLENKKAVILNFWYPDCGNCTTEFPALNSSYDSNNSVVEVLGVCSNSMGYTEDDIETYDKKSNWNGDLKFPLGLDNANLHTKFSVSAWPTTVVIDRYGMYVYREEGAQPVASTWNSLIKKYTADDYVQDITSDDDPDSGGSTTSTREKPDVTMPSSTEMQTASCASGLTASFRTESDDEYSWPWTTATVDGKSCITVTNSGKHSSYAIVYADIAMKAGEVLSFEYYYSTEKNYDYLYVMLNGQMINDSGWTGESDGWQSTDIYVADEDRTIELCFVFRKDSADADSFDGEDTAMIRNIHTYASNAQMDALDVIREAASGETSQGKYENYKTAVLGDDGFYHVDAKDGPLLYISINNITQWSELHTDENTFEYDSSTMNATLYLMTYYMYSSKSETPFTVVMGDDGRDFADELTAYYHLLDALTDYAPYYLMPVGQQLRDWAEAFVESYEKDNDGTAHDDEWLEFCYYYDHYGTSHETGVACKKTDDVTVGLTQYNPITIPLSTSSPADGATVATVYDEVEYPLSRPNSLYYTFTAPATGVYRIMDYKDEDESGNSNLGTDLYISVYGSDGTLTDYAESSGVKNFDQYSDEKTYYSYNTYVKLEAGKTYIFEVMAEEQVEGKIHFDITYYTSVSLLFEASDGMWTYYTNDSGSTVFMYIGINFTEYNGKYYLRKDNSDNGEADPESPIYINMLYSSYYMDGTNNYKSVEELCELGLFSAADEVVIKKAVEEAKANTGEYYGTAVATTELVSALSHLIADTDDANGGVGNGWLCFALYLFNLS